MILAKPERAFIGYRVRSDQRAAFCDQSVDVVHERRAVIGKRKFGNSELAKRLHKIVVLRIPAVAVDLDLGSLASGTYTLRITAANGEQVTRKFIVNK